MEFSLAGSAIKKRILIIKHGALGDLIQAIGVMMDIRQYHQNSHISLLISPAYLALMQRCIYIDDIIIDHRASVWRLDLLWQLKRQLHQQDFDCVYDLQNSARTRWYRQYVFQHRQWIGRHKSEAAPASGLAGLLALLNQANIPIKYSHQADLSWMLADVTAILKHEGIKNPYIALIPGSSAQHPEKRWPHFAELACLLMAHGYQVVTILGPAETALARDLPGAVLSGLDWFELAGILNEALFMVGNDTGPSHLASHLNKPGLALFGASSSANRSDIGHRRFTTLQVPDLAALAADKVFDQVLNRISEPN